MPWSILTLCSHLQSGLFTSHLLTKILYAFHKHNMQATCSTHFIILHLITIYNNWCVVQIVQFWNILLNNRQQIPNCKIKHAEVLSDCTLNLNVQFCNSMDHPYTQCHNVLCHNPNSLDRHDLLQHEATATLYSTHNSSGFQRSGKKTTEDYGNCNNKTLDAKQSQLSEQ